MKKLIAIKTRLLMCLNLLLLGALLSTTASALSPIFLCKKGKSITYQDSPCRSGYEQQVIDSQIAAPSIEGPSTDSSVAQTTGSTVDTSGTKLVLTRSADSHFYIDGSVHGVSIRFLIDTGASMVALPEEIAKAAKLIEEKAVMLKTASGTTHGYQTTIDQLTLANFSFNTVQAEIVSGSQALLGMNILSQFIITQESDQMTLQHK
jgi:aspartyl protease family protein